MAKSRAQASQRIRPSRAARQADSERWNRLLLIGGVVAVILVAAGFIAYGWYDTHVKPYGKTVLAVGDTKYSLGHLERRLKAEKNADPSLASKPELVVSMPEDVMATLEFEATLLQSAGELNITVTDEDVANEVKTTANLAADADPKLYANAFRDQVNESGLKEHEYRQKLQAQILAQRVRDYFNFLAPTSEPQVRSRWMTFDTSEKAQQALDRLNGGEDFKVVAQALAADGTGTERDWAPRGGSAALTLPTEVEDFLFSAQPGTRSQVISVGTSYYVADLQEKDPNRALDDNGKAQVAQRNMTDWLKSKNEALNVQRDLSPENKAKILKDAFPEIFG